jgi:endonuclease III
VSGLDTPSAVIALVSRFGGRYSSELAIDLDGGDAEVERWFLASTLFGARISARIAAATYAELSRAGITRIVDVGRWQWHDLVALLDAGGYARYDFRTATRLQDLAQAINERYDGEVAAIGRRHVTLEPLVNALDELPGWGPVTVRLFLREMRGVWPGASPPLDPLAAQAARHLGLITDRDAGAISRIARVAEAARCDERDLEAALVRLALAHRRTVVCPGGDRCILLASHNPKGNA